MDVLSRRDLMKVAWHEVPGIKQKWSPSHRDGMMSVSAARGLLPGLNCRHDRPITPYPTGRDRGNAASPGTSCQATFIRSLRDKSFDRDAAGYINAHAS